MNNLTNAEDVVLRGFDQVLDSNELWWCYARMVLPRLTIDDKTARKAIKSLRTKGFLRFHRGGTNEDGELCGGSGYGITQLGRKALAGTIGQEELAL